MVKRTRHSEPEPATDYSEDEDQVDDHPCCEECGKREASAKSVFEELPHTLRLASVSVSAYAGVLSLAAVVLAWTGRLMN